MHTWSVCIFLICGIVCCQSINIDVLSAPAVQNISNRFVGVALDSGLIRDKWRTLNFSSPKLYTLARNLAPTYLRVGGADADFLVFNQSDVHKYNFDMTVDEWDTLNQFSNNAGWDFIFDFNLLLRKNGKWDPTNAMELLNYTSQRGYRLAGYELGNEPDLFSYLGEPVSPATLVKDIGIMRDVLSLYPSQPSFVLGPDASNITSIDYFHQFMKAGGGQVVDVATFHHYYMSSASATVDKFHNASVLESLREKLELAVSYKEMYSPNTPLWLGETSSSYEGGAPNISDRYVAGFLWLDKLGLSAEIGMKAVIRQDFYGLNYALIDANSNPNNDYWITILYKRLVGSPVLRISGVADPNVRVYAHCTSADNQMGYKKGSVTVYFMNLGSEPVTFNINGGTQDLCLLSPGDQDGLLSKYIKLNGQILTMPNDQELPPLNPETNEGSLDVPGYGIGFVVLPDANKPECLNS